MKGKRYSTEHKIRVFFEKLKLFKPSSSSEEPSAFRWLPSHNISLRISSE
jgi:hypothetical protein